MWPNPQETANLVTFTEKILNGKFHFLRSEIWSDWIQSHFKTKNIAHTTDAYLKPCQTFKM